MLKILSIYPTDPALVEASTASVLLQRLSSVLFALPPGLFSINTIRHIGRSKVYVEDALPVLAVLYSTEFLTYIATDPSPLEEHEHDNEAFSSFASRNKKQKKSKRKHRNTASIDISPFQKLGVKIPFSYAEAVQMARDISDKLKSLLQVCRRLLQFQIYSLTRSQSYLELLLEPILAPQLRDAYVSTHDDATDTPRPLAPAPRETAVVEAAEAKPSAYPKVQPIKAALYFENAEGFGDWRIIVSTNATKKLRELANGDRKKCAIVVKKIKYVACACWCWVN